MPDALAVCDSDDESLSSSPPVDKVISYAGANKSRYDGCYLVAGLGL